MERLYEDEEEEEDELGQTPSEEDVIEFARYLGMNLPEDNDLLWIAR